MPLNEDRQGSALPIVCVVALTVSVLFLLYSRSDSSKGYLDKLKNKSETINETLNLRKKVTIREQQPSCPPRSKTLELTSITHDILWEKFHCKPQDVTNPEKHKIPKFYFNHSLKNNSSNETQNAIVNFIIAALLLTSLGAALLEFYRAKIGNSPKSEKKKGLKAPVNRKCSLADLTVLKHHRKELVRRESVLEQHCEEEEGSRLYDSFKSPLHRRCSFPVSLPSSVDSLSPGPRKSRKLSLSADRRLSFINESGRKLSLIPDDVDLLRRGSFIQEETSSSPDRRHSRLVHRH
ncbi:hypothetical protein ABEB36_009691 [Hypothenemus hampei]|uniref:Uncharacterized protein n=1 Tax=Hypothenemus hampei TaxID=57062 RepID=A0ABD1EJA4_HYPHA